MQQTFRLPVVLTNLQTLFSVFCLVGIEAVNCVTVARNEDHKGLVDRMEDLKMRGLLVFQEAIRGAKA